MSIHCFKDLIKYGAQETLEKEYGEWLVGSESEGKEVEYDVTLCIDLEKIPEDDASRISLINHISMLKPTLFSSPFHTAFLTSSQLSTSSTHIAGGQDQPREKEGDWMTIGYRENEAIYIQARGDRVTVIFRTVFNVETDRVFGKVFLQEFVDARRLPSIQNAPQVLYANREAPLEIRHLVGGKTGEEVGYITFVLFPRHYSNPDVAIKTTLQLQLFRDYLHYHIKCSKAYMHSRMRYRVSEFQKVLNRAKPEVQGTGERKTATGRTFRSR